MPPKTGDEGTLEFFAVGSRLIGRVGDTFVTSTTDDQWARGSARISGSEDIRDIEVINLYGLSEAEVLKILGVDEKGNDLRKTVAVAATSPAPSVSKSPPLPVSKSSEQKFLPGQWVKMFTKLEDLPPTLRSRQPSTLQDGWIKAEGSAEQLHLPPHLNGNYALRALFRRRADNKLASYLNLRVHGSDNQRYQLFLSEGGFLSLQSQHGKFTTLTSVQPKRKFKPGETFHLSLGIVGSRLVTRLGSELMRSHVDATHASGKGSLHLQDDVRDIEVINLDGLPEAEALKILGVDEKGNDLQALAAKQEQQMVEQAKAVDAMAAIPELKTLHEQFVKLQAERVTAPFEAEVAKLNAGYVGGIDREIANEKKAGHLDGVIALEAEKKLIQGVGTSLSPPSRDQDGPAPSPIPAEDDAATTEALKKLRGIYRAAYAKFEAARAENLKTLTAPLDNRLKQLEATLTQQDRIADAKTVREYRENLGKQGSLNGSADTPAHNATTGGASATMKEVDKSARSSANKLSPEEIVEWVLSRQGKLTIEKSGQKMTIEAGIPIPSGAFKILVVDFNKTTEPRDPIPDTELENLSGLKDMKELHLQGRSGFTGSFLASLSASRDLDTLNIAVSSFQPEHISSVSLFPNLARIRIAGGQVAEALISLPSLRKLRSIAIHGVPTPEMLQSLTKHPELSELRCISRDWKVEHFRAMVEIKTLTSLELQSLSREPETFVILAPLTKLESVYFSVSIKSDQFSGLEAFKNLKKIVFNASDVADDVEGVVAKLALSRSLERVELVTLTPDDEKLIKTAEVIQKTLGKAKVVLHRP